LNSVGQFDLKKKRKILDMSSHFVIDLKGITMNKN